MDYKSKALEDQFTKILKEYTDSLGRITYLKAKVSNWEAGIYDSLNQHLWTGEALMLWVLCCNVTDGWVAYWKKTVQNVLDKTLLAPGLLMRHPYPYIKTDKYDAISLDEYFGAMMYCKVVGNLWFPKDAILYGEKVAWCVIDQPLYVNKSPKDYIWKWSFWKTAFKAIAFAIKTRDFTGSNEMDKILEEDRGVDLVSSYRMPKDQLFIYLAAGEQPGLLMWVHFYIAAFLTLRVSNDEKSGRILLFFKLLFLQKFYNGPHKWLAKYYRSKMKKKYGNLYLHECFKLYYEEHDHPFIEIAKSIYIDDNGFIDCIGELNG